MGAGQARKEAQLFFDLYAIRIRDADWRVKARPKFGWALAGLLVAQNVGLTGLIFWAATQSLLERLTPLIIGVTSGTLVETAAIIQIIVRWLFKDIDYKR